MNKNLFILFLLSGLFLEIAIQASSESEKEKQEFKEESKEFGVIRLDSTVPLFSSSKDSQEGPLYDQVVMKSEYKDQIAFGRSLSKAKLHNNTSFTLYIGLLGSQDLYPILANGFIMLATPYNYLIYPTNKATGPALLLTYNNNNLGTQNSVHACYVQNGEINLSIPQGTEEKFTGTAALYKDDIRPLGGVSIYTDFSKKTAFSLSSL